MKKTFIFINSAASVATILGFIKSLIGKNMLTYIADHTGAILIFTGIALFMLSFFLSLREKYREMKKIAENYTMQERKIEDLSRLIERRFQELEPKQ